MFQTTKCTQSFINHPWLKLIFYARKESLRNSKFSHLETTPVILFTMNFNFLMTVIRKNWISYFELPVITDSALSVHGTVMLQN